MVNLAKALNFYSAEWKVLKLHLEEQKEIMLRKLIGSTDHDESNILRGSIRVIDRILKSEQEAASEAANRSIDNDRTNR